MSLTAKDDHPRLRASGWLMGLLFVGAGASQVKLQAFERDGTLALADNTKRFNVSRKEHAKRGAILASDNRALAVDEDAYELNVRFDKVPKSEAFFLALAAATGIPASEFQALAANGHRSRAWRQPVSQAQAEAVNKVRSDWRADGVSLARVARRAYPLGEAASGIVGLLREQGAVLGLEKSQDTTLSGEDGMRKGLTDKRGAFLPMRLAAETKERRDGNTIQLTLDTELQVAAATAIRAAVEENKADNGVALVMDPKTGDILASANWPSYRPYQADGTPGPIAPGEDFNPAVMAQLEPGSTFKILTLAKALDDGKVRSGEFLYCPGIYHPTAKTRVRCDAHGGKRAHGSISVDNAIAKSCNVAAASWAIRVGRTPFIDYVRDLGLLNRSHLGMPGEQHGNFNYGDPAPQLQLANVGFGQALTCTPIGLIGAFGMLANHGVRMEPRLIKRVGSEEIVLAPGKRIVSEETAARVLDCMEAVIESDAGTGKTLRVPGHKLGGKTGTAQKIGRGVKGYVSNFIGFVPSQAPRAVVLVMVNNPKAGKYYGASVAGPAFKTMAEAVIRRYSIPPTEPIAPPKEKP
ncbi:MAG: peptidoglycan D,D-transpeptidase FtsI family protein [Fimbriimonas sp.]